MPDLRECIDHLKNAIVKRELNRVEDLVRKAIQEGVDLNLIINDALIAAMDIVGQRFTEGEIFIPEMLGSALTLKKGLEIIKPLLKESNIIAKGTIVMGTVKGDLHDIGKNLVIMMWEGAGFHVIDLGVNVSVEKFVQHVQEIKPEILGLSALLTTTLPEMKEVIDALNQKGLRTSVKVIVGGAPVDETFAKKIGADGYGKDAAEAVRVAKQLIAKCTDTSV
jgi:5-methyltetrahydrofolate--homocysteine methyltransferase